MPVFRSVIFANVLVHVRGNFWKMLWLSPAIAALATVLGICASYVLDASSGGMIGVVLGILFALAAIFGSRGVRVHITAVGN